MKFRTLLLTALIASPFAAAATGPIKEKALALSASNKESVVQLSATVEIEVTAGEMPTKKEEKKLEVIGSVLNKDGLIVESRYHGNRLGEHVADARPSSAVRRDEAEWNRAGGWPGLARVLHGSQEHLY